MQRIESATSSRLASCSMKLRVQSRKRLEVMYIWNKQSYKLSATVRCRWMSLIVISAPPAAIDTIPTTTETEAEGAEISQVEGLQALEGEEGAVNPVEEAQVEVVDVDAEVEEGH
mmetsp:Transcript_32068/g.52987  ORF Transcript_32068/g.52987 Transcript_32068/m.52987 type:complete len:115 (+) Transcript_32068:874-1218(+)